MDPDVAEDPAYRDTLQDTLRALPTLAIIAEHAALWSEETGIYMNPSKSGSDWERGGTAIYLPGDTGGDGFTIDCGLRMQGGTSVLGWKTHKLSLRLLFKAAWGPSKLAYPLYPGSPVDKFDTLVADAHLNHTWHHPWQDQQESADYARDRFLADQMLAIGSLAPRGRFVHFYLNGLYWGLYELHERPDDSFCAEHLGGDKDEWDVIKHDSSQVVAGDPTAWDEMMDVVRSQLGGDDKLAALQQHLDVAAFIDYQLVNFWAGNTDWPHHNWYGARHRSEAGRWQFFSWDAEHVLEGLDDNESDNFHEDSPGELWGALLESEAFREQVTARAEQLFNGGDGFAPDQIYFQAAASIRDAVVAESARWGDLRRPDQAYTRDVEWETEQTRLAEQYFPHRTARVIEHLEALDIEVELDDEP
jgi:hypothetical protein